MQSRPIGLCDAQVPASGAAPGAPTSTAAGLRAADYRL